MSASEPMVRPWKEPVKDTISVAQFSAISALYGSRPAAMEQSWGRGAKVKHRDG